MSIQMKLASDAQTVNITVCGHFDFQAYRYFSRMLERAVHPNARFMIHVRDTEHLHDAGLSILLMLRNLLGKERIEGVRCPPKTRNTLCRYGF